MSRSKRENSGKRRREEDLTMNANVVVLGLPGARFAGAAALAEFRADAEA
jgi:hypothetical protein